MDAGTTAGAVLASTVRVGVRARVNGKGRSSTFSRGGAAICTNGAARNHRALPRCVGAGSSRGHVKHRLHVPATFQLWNGSPAASGGEGSCSGFATQACESLASEIRAERGRAELMNRQARQFAAASTGEASADALVSKGFGPPALLASGGDGANFSCSAQAHCQTPLNLSQNPLKPLRWPPWLPAPYESRSYRTLYDLGATSASVTWSRLLWPPRFR